jgi:hypothetical protein
MKMEQSVPKRRHINSRRWGITQKKAYKILNFAETLKRFTPTADTIHVHVPVARIQIENYPTMFILTLSLILSC